jgi:hypothetical protein
MSAAAARSSLSKLDWSLRSVKPPTTSANASRITNVSPPETAASFRRIGSRTRAPAIGPLMPSPP